MAKLYRLQFLLSTANDVCHFCASFSPVPIFIKATLGVYQHQFAIMKHGACIPLMCDHYTNEVNGSAVLTKRWMPPSGSCPPPLRGSWCASENSFVRVSAFGGALNSVFKKILLSSPNSHCFPSPPPTSSAGASSGTRDTYDSLHHPELSLSVPK